MMRLAMKSVLLALTCAFGGQVEDQNPKLTPAVRARAIEGVVRVVNRDYVFPEVAKKMEEAVRARLAKKEYDGYEDGNALAERLTRDLQAISHDLHLRVHYSANVLPAEESDSPEPTPRELEEMRRILARDNYGFPKVEVLRGNIGYIECRYFAPLEMAAETYVAAMNYVANTDALILDLRGSNGSMSEETLPMICGYFFEKPVHLNDFYWRRANSIRQTWTAAHVPGKRYLNKPIYVLTSGRTFSGAEELAYDLKNLKRATLIGDTTGGGRRERRRGSPRRRPF